MDRVEPERVCFVYHLRPGMGQQYDHLHENVWPVAKAELCREGWTSYEIFRRGDLVITVGSRPQICTILTTPGDEVEALRGWRAAVAECLIEYEDEKGHTLNAPLVYQMLAGLSTAP